jgi:Uma2 family endonuclease
MANWVAIYADETPGCEGGLATTWVMEKQSVLQPDVALRIVPKSGGQSSEVGGYCTDAAEMIVEISGSSLSRDLGAKLQLYQRAGVREYLTVILRTQQVSGGNCLAAATERLHPAKTVSFGPAFFPGSGSTHCRV